jgi:hypothetical protein
MIKTTYILAYMGEREPSLAGGWTIVFLGLDFVVCYFLATITLHDGHSFTWRLREGVSRSFLLRAGMTW